MDYNGKYLRKIVNESLDELTSDYETYDDYKKRSHGGFFVYSQVDSRAIDNICKNGTEGSKEFLRVMCYGRGIYTVMSYKDCTSYYHENSMVKYLVKKGAFDNFIIFDNDMRRKLISHGVLNRDEKVSETVRRLFSDEDFRMLERYYGDNLWKLDREVNESRGGSSHYIQDQFLNICRNGEGNIRLNANISSYPSEKRLDVSNVDGWGYRSGYGDTLIFRTVDLLTPYSYFISNRGRWPATDREGSDGFRYCIKSEEDFENINVSIDAFRRSRGKYPDTRFLEKTIGGFALVRKGKKYNLLNARTGEYISPVDFDKCAALDPISHSAVFIVDSGDPDIGNVEFMLKSIDRGRDIAILLNNDGEFEPITFDEFIGFMDEIKESRQDLNESVDEVFTHKSYSEFMNRDKGNDIILYRATSPEVAKSEFENGSNMEYSGTGGDDSLYYGVGVYCVRNRESLFHDKYGNGLVKFVLKDGYKDFLILDKYLRDKYDPGSTVYDELVRLVPEDIMKKIDSFLKSGNFPPVNNYETMRHMIQHGVEGFKNTELPNSRQRGKSGHIEYNTASFCRLLKLALQGHRLHDPLARMMFDELLMAKTRIRGFVFNGGSDGNVVLVRDFAGLMPIDYSVDRGRTWKNASSEEQFNRVNQRVDPFYQYRGEYPKTHHREKSRCGFTLVNGDNGYNYKDIWYHRNLLPIDVDKAYPFNPADNTASFSVNADGDTFNFIVHTDDDYNITLLFVNDEDGSNDVCDYDTFMEVAEMTGKKIYKNNLLNPENDRSK